MRKISWRLVVSSWRLVFLFYLFTFSLSHFLFSAIPSAVKYQGVLKEKGVLVNGTKTIKFRITNSNGDTEYWTSGNVSVTFTQGAFFCRLEPTGINWGTGDYYLEVAIDGQILLPREEIVSTVYALRASKVDIIPWSDITGMPACFADGTDDGAGASLDTIGSYHIIDSTITNADISPTAAIAYSKLNLANQILTGDIKDNEITASDLNQSNVATVFLITSSATATYVFKSGDTMTGDLNSNYKIIGSTMGDTNTKLYGDGSSLIGTSQVDSACRSSTGTIQTQLNNVALSTGTLRNEVITSTASLVAMDNTIKTSTGTLVMKSGDTMTGDLNSAYKIIGSTMGDTNTKLYGDGSSLTKLPVRQFYNLAVSTSVNGWIGKATTSSGVATFYPTSDGLVSGTALFTDVTSVQATAEMDTATVIAVPLASVKSISANKKTITVNVITGKNLAALGDTVAFAPDGTVVYLTVFGN